MFPCPGQSEYGDLYKVTLGYSNDKVTEVKIKYFDTIPVCTSICVLKTGFLFAASEAGNHALYLFIVSTVYMSLTSFPISGFMSRHEGAPPSACRVRVMTRRV